LSSPFAANTLGHIALSFLELNVRTYVTVDHTPGVWFFSLDAASPTAERLARATYRLPYYRAHMQMRHENEWIAYSSRRSIGNAAFRGRYQPVGPSRVSLPGGLEYWLTERYCLYAANQF